MVSLLVSRVGPLARMWSVPTTTAFGNDSWGALALNDTFCFCFSQSSPRIGEVGGQELSETVPQSRITNRRVCCGTEVMQASGHSAGPGVGRTYPSILDPQLRHLDLPVSLFPHLCNWYSNPLQNKTGGCLRRVFNWAQPLC